MKLPTLSAMIELYGTSMALTLDARQFLIQVESLKRLALNAEVLAVKVSNGGDVFQTLAREIARLTTNARAIIGELQTQSIDIAAKAVHTASQARLCEKYQQVLEQETTPLLKEQIEVQLNSLGSQMVRDLSTITESLRHTRVTLADIGRLHVQLPVIATLLNIESHRDANTDPALTTNAQSLLVLKDRLSELHERVQSKTNQTLALLRNLG